MKIDLTPREILSIYNLVILSGQSDSLKGDCETLDSVIDKIRSAILLGLTHPAVEDPLGSWIKLQESKLASNTNR